MEPGNEEKMGLRFLTIILAFLCLEALANDCANEPGKPCTIEVESTLPSGKTYHLSIIEDLLGNSEDKPMVNTGYWGEGGAFPDTFIRSISLVVEGDSYWIPPKAYADLGNLNKVEVKENPHAIVLVVSGGKAAGPYYATFVFIDQKVRKRTVRSSRAPDRVWERTVYQVAE